MLKPICWKIKKNVSRCHLLKVLTIMTVKFWSKLLIQIHITWCQTVQIQIWRSQLILISTVCHHQNMLTPLKPHFYIVKLGFTGVYIIFLISAQNIDSGYMLELPWCGSTNEYPQSMFLSRNSKNIRIFIWKFSFFLVVKFSVYSNGVVFVMQMQGISRFSRTRITLSVGTVKSKQSRRRSIAAELGLTFHVIQL